MSENEIKMNELIYNSESITCNFALKSSKSNCYALDQAERTTNVEIIDIRTCLTKDDKIFIFVLLKISD
jgi:hypothetical protein